MTVTNGLPKYTVPGVSVQKSYIVAGNMDEFRHFVARKKVEHDNNMKLMPEYVYVHNVDRLRGLSEVHGWFIGSYEQRSDINLIKSTITIINMPHTGAKFDPYFNVIHTPTGSKIVGQEITAVWLDDLEDWKSTAPVWNPSQTVYNNSST